MKNLRPLGASFELHPAGRPATESCLVTAAEEEEVDAEAVPRPLSVDSKLLSVAASVEEHDS